MPPTETEGVDESLFPSKAELGDAEKLWQDGLEEAEKRNPVGSFLMEITEAALERSASSGQLQIHYHLKIIGGQHDKIEIDKYDGLGKPRQAAITQGQLRKLGVPIKTVSVKTLPAELLKFVGKKVVGSAKQNGEFYNISFTRMANESITRTPAAAPSGESSGQGKKGGKKPKF